MTAKTAIWLHGKLQTVCNWLTAKSKHTTRV